MLHLNTNSHDDPLHTPPLCQGDGLGGLGFHGTSKQGHNHKIYSNHFPLLVSANPACHI